jgi:hypothetical protein
MENSPEENGEMVLEYNKTFLVDMKSCLKCRTNRCTHRVREPGEYGWKLMESWMIPYKCQHYNQPVPIHFEYALLKEFDTYIHFRLRDGRIVSHSETCEETSPCEHSFKMNGGTVDWDVFDFVSEFQKKGDPIPKHFKEYVRGRDHEY